MGGGSSFWKENKFIRCVTLLTDVSSALSLASHSQTIKREIYSIRADFFKRGIYRTGRLLKRESTGLGRLLERRIYQGGQACLFDKELKFPYQSAAVVDMSLLRHLLNSVATAAPVGKEFLSRKVLYNKATTSS